MYVVFKLDTFVSVKVCTHFVITPLNDILLYFLCREEADEDFITDFSDVLVLNVINVATKACQDSDKVKPNGVRALGSILRYISKKQLCM
jgi:site-specific recombinase